MTDKTTITIPIEDYRRLLDASEADDTIVRCETCSAWLDHEEAAITDDFTGCWKAATGRSEYDHLCKSYRALDRGSPRISGGEIPS